MDYRILLIAPLAALVLGAAAGTAPPRMPLGWMPADHVSPATPSPKVPVGYEIGLDPQASGPPSLTVRAILPQGTQRQGLGAAYQVVHGQGGRRVRFSGQVRAEGLATWAGLYVGSGDFTLLSDLTAGRPGIEHRLPRGVAVRPGSGWQEVSVVFDAPAGTEPINLGLALVGEGQAWMRELRFDVVGPQVPTTTSTLAYDWVSVRTANERGRATMAALPPQPLRNPALD